MSTKWSKQITDRSSNKTSVLLSSLFISLTLLYSALIYSTPAS
jgi:hypothetical protein